MVTDFVKQAKWNVIRALNDWHVLLRIISREESKLNRDFG